MKTSITRGEIDDAVRRALELRVAEVTAQLDYEFLDEHAESSSEFICKWLPRLEAAERFTAANWAVGQYVTAMVHIDDAYGLAARLLSEAQQSVAKELSASLRDFAALTHGPDAVVSPDVSTRFARYADELDEMDFSVVSKG